MLVQISHKLEGRFWSMLFLIKLLLYRVQLSSIFGQILGAGSTVRNCLTIPQNFKFLYHFSRYIYVRCTKIILKKVKWVFL